MQQRSRTFDRLIMLLALVGEFALYAHCDAMPSLSDGNCATPSTASTLSGRSEGGGTTHLANDPKAADPTEEKVYLPKCLTAATAVFTEDWQAGRFIEGYTDQVYAKMRDDQARTGAYQRAISALVANKTVLDIGTGALALLAVMAAKAGATKVFAIEGNEEAFHKAVRTVADEGLSEKVTVIFGHSTKVNLPFKVDMVLHEILGEIASIEGAGRAIRDAQARHLSAFPSPERVSIPASAASFICPCEMPDGDYWAQQPFPVILPPGVSSLKLWKFPRRSLLCREWQEMERLDFEGEGGLRLVDTRELAFTVQKSGVFSGFVIRMQASLLTPEAEEISTWCWDEEKQEEGCQGHWAQQMVVFNAHEVAEGDVVDLSVTTDTSTLQPQYSFRAMLRRKADQGGGPEKTTSDEKHVDLGQVVLDQPNTG